jgi:hypothetical protein
MNQLKLGSIVVGVDVGGPTKGFHAVALQDGQYHERPSELIAEKVEAGDESAEQINVWSRPDRL